MGNKVVLLIKRSGFLTPLISKFWFINVNTSFLILFPHNLPVKSQNNVLKSLIKHSRIPKILLTLMKPHKWRPTLTLYDKNIKNFHKNAISFQKSNLFLDKAFHSRYLNFYVWNLWYKNCSWNIWIKWIIFSKIL